MKILVTGGAGYIGSVVTADLIAAGNQVVVYDNLSTGTKRAISKHAQLVVGELNDQEQVQLGKNSEAKLLDKTCSCTVHLCF